MFANAHHAAVNMVPALGSDPTATALSTIQSPTYQIVSTVSMALSAYHGYVRHSGGEHPLAWAIGWAFLGGLFPVVTPVIAVAQGFGKKQ